MIKEFRSIYAVNGYSVFATGVFGVKYGDYAEIVDSDGILHPCTVAKIDGDNVELALLSEPDGIDIKNSRLRVDSERTGARMSLSPDILGRQYNGVGYQTDMQPSIIPEKRRNVIADPIPLSLRDDPSSFITTGVPCIDAFVPLMKGHRMPIVSRGAVSGIDLATKIAKNTSFESSDNGESSGFAIVVGALSVLPQEMDEMILEIRRSGKMDRCTVFSCDANAPLYEKLMMPYYAVTAAEYLAFDLSLDVVLILGDMTEYEKYRRVVQNDQVFAESGSIFERAGRMKGWAGSITFIPVFSRMPENESLIDSADGAIVLSDDLARHGYEYPIDILASCENYKGQRIKDDKWAHLANDLIKKYEKARRSPASGKKYIDAFERYFLNTSRDHDRESDEKILASDPLCDMI